MAPGAVFTMRTSSPLGPRERLAPRSVRAVAALVDIVLFYPLLFVALAAGVVALGGALGVAVTSSRAGPWLQTLGSMFRASGLTIAASVVGVLAGLAALVVLLTQWSMLARNGQTIGKWLMGIRIVDERGEAAGLIRALLLRRWVFNAVYGSIGVTLTAWVPYVGWVWWCLDLLPLFGEERRCLHDHVAVTDVRWVRPSGPGVERVLVGLALIAAGVGGVVAFVGPAEWRALATLAGWKVPAAPVVPVPPVSPGPVVTPQPVAPPPTVVLPPPRPVVPVVVPVVPAAVVDAGVAPPPPGPAAPVAWTYEDATGVTQVVQDLAQVPEASRAKARPIR